MKFFFILFQTTALHIAAQGGSFNIVKLILNCKRYDIYAKNEITILNIL